MAEATDGSVPAGAQRGAAGQARTTAGLRQGGRGRGADKVGGCTRCESGWAASRACIVSQLEIRFRGLCGTLELQPWPHTSDACGMLPDGCVRHGCLLVCSLGTLELEGALLLELPLTTICLGLDGHHLTPRDHGSHALAGAASQTFRGARRSHKKVPRRSGVYGIADRG